MTVWPKTYATVEASEKLDFRHRSGVVSSSQAIWELEVEDPEGDLEVEE